MDAAAPGEDRPAGGDARTVGAVARAWTRIGVTGFGGPPAHIALLRRLCVRDRAWISDHEFEDALAVCNLLPGPTSTQLAIWCAGRVAGWPGALIGVAGFILPGLVIILALAALFIGTAPPQAVRAAGAGGGAAVAAVAARAALDLLGPSLARATGAARVRWAFYVALGVAAAALVGPWLVLVLLGCGVVELLVRRAAPPAATTLAATVAAKGGWAALAWTAFKVGALSFGGGFVIIPLMQADAVHRYHWMTGPQFLDAVALGQVTPGPVVLTTSVVGYAAAGVAGGVFAAVVAFTPSFVFVLAGRGRFDRLRSSPAARAFLAGAGPAAIGAILGAAAVLARELTEPWQYVVLLAAVVLLLLMRRGVVEVLLGAAAVGVALALAGVPVPG